ncbi:MAG: glycosyltransferase [Lachnospiraceae bacterium]
MKILYVYGKARTKEILVELRKLSYEVIEYEEVQSNDVLNDDKSAAIGAYAEKNGITHIMSIGLIYNCAWASYQTGIKYVAIIWDSPYIRLYTPFGRIESCYYSVFDKLDYQDFSRIGLPHVMYQPCAVSKSEIVRLYQENRPGEYYKDEISFIGSIYDHNPYDIEAHLFPPEIHSYFAGIFEEAAFKWDGTNRVYGKTSPEILKYMQMLNTDFKINNPYDISDERYFEVLYLMRKISNIERICVLNLLAEKHDMAFFTNPNEDRSSLANVRVMPPVGGNEAMRIYAHSKINLNLSIKGMEGATPQRVMDITGAGGFAITNYCEETLELFEEDKEIVTYKSPEELLEKVDYYLAHDEERKKIARAGYEKTLNCYTYDKKLTQLMKWVEGNEKG